MASGLADGMIPAVAPRGLEDSAPLEQPIEEEFRAGTMTLSWDPDDELEVEVFEEPEPQEVLLVRITPGAARAFALRAGRVVEAGRPSCPFCGGPMDPAGHLCVRANGHRRRDA
jgi:hypothetical protein